MNTYKHILVATSLNDESKKVCERAQNLAKASNAKLSIVHVVEFNPVMYGGGEFAIPLDGDLEESVHMQARKSLTSLAEQYDIPEDRQYLQTGTTTEHLTDLVSSINADLLVLGHYEHHWLAMLLGSTANSLVHEMPCDIMAVHLG